MLFLSFALSFSLLCLWINLLFRLYFPFTRSLALPLLEVSLPPSFSLSLSLSLLLALSLPPSIWRCAIRPSLLRPPLRFFLGAAPPCSNPYRKPDVDASVASLRSGVLLLSIRIAACFSIEISRGNFLYELRRAS